MCVGVGRGGVIFEQRYSSWSWVCRRERVQAPQSNYSASQGALERCPVWNTLTILQLYSIVQEMIAIEEKYQGNEKVLNRYSVIIVLYGSVNLVGKKNTNGGGIAAGRYANIFADG